MADVADGDICRLLRARQLRAVEGQGDGKSEARSPKPEPGRGKRQSAAKRAGRLRQSGRGVMVARAGTLSDQDWTPRTMRTQRAVQRFPFPSPLPSPVGMVGTRSTASLTSVANNGTRWNASLPGVVARLRRTLCFLLTLLCFSPLASLKAAEVIEADLCIYGGDGGRSGGGGAGSAHGQDRRHRRVRQSPGRDDLRRARRDGHRQQGGHRRHLRASSIIASRCITRTATPGGSSSATSISPSAAGARRSAT